MKSTHVFLILLLQLLLINACFPKAGSSTVDNALELTITDRPTAIDRLEDYIARHPTNDDIPRAMLIVAEQYRLANNLKKSRDWFEKLSSEYNEHLSKKAVITGLTLINLEQNQSSDAIEILLKMVNDPYLPRTMRSDVYRILALHEYKNQGTSAGAYAGMAWKYGNTDPATLARLKKDLQSPSATMDTKPEDTPQMNPEDISEAELYVNIQNDLRQQSFENVIEKSKVFIGRFSNSSHLSSIQAAQKRAEAKDPFTVTKIGILLPLSGRFAIAGKEIAQAVKFANSQLKKPLDLVIFDTKGEVKAAQQGVEKLVTKDGCALIIGPLLKATSLASAETAQDFQVPMLTLARQQEVISAGNFLFFVNVSLKQQINTLLDHATHDRKWTRFATLAPKAPHSKKIIEHFRKEVERRGGTVVKSHYYNLENRDFRQDARLLGGASSNQARSKQKFTPKIEFDAIFIPDNFRRSPMIASSLAYEGYPIGAFQNRGLNPVHLLGLNFWNNKLLLDASGQYMLESLFVDVFLADDPRPEVQEFSQQFRIATKRTPRPWDAIVYDCIQFITAAIAGTPSSREEMRNALSKANIDTPLTGGLRFGNDRVIDRSLQIIEISKTGFQPWKPSESND